MIKDENNESVANILTQMPRNKKTRPIFSLLAEERRVRWRSFYSNLSSDWLLWGGGTLGQLSALSLRASHQPHQEEEFLVLSVLSISRLISTKYCNALSQILWEFTDKKSNSNPSTLSGRRYNFQVVPGCFCGRQSESVSQYVWCLQPFSRAELDKKHGQRKLKLCWP